MPEKRPKFKRFSEPLFADVRTNDIASEILHLTANLHVIIYIQGLKTFHLNNCSPKINVATFSEKMSITITYNHRAILILSIQLIIHEY